MTRAQVGELFDTVHRWSPGRRKLIAVLYQAYIDESETGKDPAKVSTLSCLVAPSQRWKDMMRAWDDAMRRGGAAGKVLHMKDIVHSKGEFVGWTNAQRDNLFRRLAPVVRSYISFGFCGSIPLRYFDYVHALEWKEREKITPYLLALQGTMQAIIDRVKPSKANPVVFFIEQHKDEAEATKQFYHLTHLKRLEDRFPSITPLPKGPQPLQAADMVAYEGSRYSSEHVVRKSPRNPRGLYLALQSPKFIFTTATHDLMADYAAHVLYTAAQVRATPGLIDEINNSFNAAGRRMQIERDRAARARRRER